MICSTRLEFTSGQVPHVQDSWFKCPFYWLKPHFFWLNPPRWCCRSYNTVYPLVNVNKKLWKITMFNGKIHYKWSFSMAMLNYQRVVAKKRYQCISTQTGDVEDGSLMERRKRSRACCAHQRPSLPQFRSDQRSWPHFKTKWWNAGGRNQVTKMWWKWAIADAMRQNLGILGTPK